MNCREPDPPLWKALTVGDSAGYDVADPTQESPESPDPKVTRGMRQMWCGRQPNEPNALDNTDR